MENLAENLGIIILVIVFGYIFYGPHAKSKGGDDKGGKGGKK